MDLKLENIVITDDYDVALIDFELSENLSNQTCRYKGTARYMAPEVKACKSKKEFYLPKMADIYSLGVCFFGILYEIP